MVVALRKKFEVAVATSKKLSGDFGEPPIGATAAAPLWIQISLALSKVYALNLTPVRSR